MNSFEHRFLRTEQSMGSLVGGASRNELIKGGGNEENKQLDSIFERISNLKKNLK